MASPSQLQDLNVFTCFSALPAELRQMIFRWCMHRPREIAVGVLLGEVAHRSLRVMSGHDSSETFIPEDRIKKHGIVLLQVCSESRDVALEFVKPMFATALPQPIHFNPVIDTLVIQSYDALLVIVDRKNRMNGDLRDIATIRNLAIHGIHDWPNRAQRLTFRVFVGTEKLTLFIDASAWSIWENNGRCQEYRELMKDDNELIMEHFDWTVNDAPLALPELVFERGD